MKTIEEQFWSYHYAASILEAIMFGQLWLYSILGSV